MAVQTTGAVDVVGIFDSKFNQLFQTARPMRATVDEDAELFKHPLETGYKIADHRIILPVIINIQARLPEATFRDVYNSIRAGYKAGNSYTVRLRTADYPNMVIARMPHEETPDDWNCIPLYISFEELQTAGATLAPLAARKVSDGDTSQKGQQQGETGSWIYNQVFK